MSEILKQGLRNFMVDVLLWAGIAAFVGGGIYVGLKIQAEVTTSESEVIDTIRETVKPECLL